jgi:oxygen-independent coproporphyrinogen III oxidase
MQYLNTCFMLSYTHMEKFSLYLHVPFCRHRCSYCDFNTFAGQERQIPAYVDALCREIRQVSAGAPGGQRLPVHTLFFGGGTPSLLSVDQIRAILETARSCFDVSEAAEITIEANPGTVNLAYLQSLRKTGVNRLSFGMQSAHPDDLRLLERQHDFFDVVQAVRWARQAGFDNLSLDLIFGLPGQSLERWQDTVDRAVGMDPDHLSLYALTIEHGTPLQKRWARGQIPLVDDDLAADMYEYAMQRLPDIGYAQHEISNWARPDGNGGLKSCLHNLQYWYNLPYLGVGPGAHGFVPGWAMASDTGCRTMNVGGIKPFIERCNGDITAEFPAGPATRRRIPVDRRTEMQETMMVGLRLVLEGVSAEAFEARFGEPLTDVFGKEIEGLLRQGLLEWTDDHLRLTPRGRMLGNRVFSEFV